MGEALKKCRIKNSDIASGEANFGACNGEIDKSSCSRDICSGKIEISPRNGENNKVICQADIEKSTCNREMDNPTVRKRSVRI